MPLPKLKPNESEEEFIPRCIKTLSDKGEFDSQEQRIAICYSIIKKKNESKINIQSILKDIK